MFPVVKFFPHIIFAFTCAFNLLSVACLIILATVASLPYFKTASSASFTSLLQGGKPTSQPNSNACSINSLPALSLSGHSITRLPNFSIKCACSGVTLLPCMLTPSSCIASNTPLNLLQL